MSRVLLHIGLSKTGTTSIQSALQSSSPRLADAGICFPFGKHYPQRLGIYDLMGRRIPGDDAESVAGAFDRLVAEIDAWPGPTVVISEELLSLARPAAVRRLLKALDRHDVHVVMTIRDLSRTICSSWQQQIFQGQDYTWPDYLSALRDPGSGPAGAGVAFWLRQDPRRVLAPWLAHLTAERVHVVTVPAEGQPRDLLLARFADAIGAPAQALRLDKPPKNQSVGPVELEVLRRLNARLTKAVDMPSHAQVIGPAVLGRLGDRSSGRLTLPESELGWVTERAAEITREITDQRFRIHGDLTDLVPHAEAGGETPEPSDDDLLAATEAALTQLAIEYGELQRKHRRARRKVRGDEATAGQKLSSSGRSLGYRVRLAAVRAADRNRLAGRLARSYLRRSGR